MSCQVNYCPYLGANGTIASQATGITAIRSETVGLPLAGASFRAFPIHGRVDVELNGSVKGMSFGGYGYFVQGSGNIGLGVKHVLVEAGYRFVNTDVHQKNGLNAVSPVFQGPVVSLVLRM